MITSDPCLKQKSYVVKIVNYVGNENINMQIEKFSILLLLIMRFMENKFYHPMVYYFKD